MRFLLAAVFGLLLVSPVGGAGGDKPLKPGTVHHLSSRKHAHPYSLYVPSSYSRKVSWPLVISSHGRGGSGKGEIGAWTGLAKEHGFIVACPDMLTATVNRPPTSKLQPHEEDDEVILSIVAEISERFRTNRRAVMITGFSGGGNPSYYTGLGHPDVFTHICTRGGNFAPHQVPRDEKVLAAGRKRISIYIFFGEFDHPLILGEGGKPGQAQMAKEALEKAGYERIEYEKVPGMKHQSRPKKAAEWFGAFLAANKKRFVAGDKVDALLTKARAAVAKEKFRDALRELKKVEAIEKKAGLEPIAAKEKEALNAVAMKMIETAKEAHAAGETGRAKKIAGRVARDFRGLPAADLAKSLSKEWKE